MSISSALGLVSGFFMDIVNMVFDVEFFEGMPFGKIALFVLLICLLFDILLQIMGRSFNDGERQYTTETNTRTVNKNTGEVTDYHTTKVSTRRRSG